MCYAGVVPTNGGTRGEKRMTRNKNKVPDFLAAQAYTLGSWLPGSLGFAESGSPNLAFLSYSLSVSTHQNHPLEVGGGKVVFYG